MADGSIRIETSIDTKGLQADLRKLEKSIEKSASEIESLRSKMNEFYHYFDTLMKGEKIMLEYEIKKKRASNSDYYVREI